MRTLLLILAIGMTGSLYNQQFELYMESKNNGTKSILFGPGHYIDMDIDFTPDEVECENQDFVRMTGSIMDIEKDSLSFFAQTVYNGLNYDCVSKPKARKYLTGEQIKKIALDDIESLSVYKSRKQQVRKGRLAEIGLLLIPASIVTATTAFIIGGEQRNDFLIASGAQLGVGFTMAIIFTSSEKSFGNPNPWKIRKRR